jgi:hypothetical protein
MFNRVDCFLKTLWYSLVHFISTGGSTTPVMGHVYVTEEVHVNCTVLVSYCENCGDLDISWHHGKPTDEYLKKCLGRKAKTCDCLRGNPVSVPYRLGEED